MRFPRGHPGSLRTGCRIGAAQPPTRAGRHQINTFRAWWAAGVCLRRGPTGAAGTLFRCHLGHFQEPWTTPLRSGGAAFRLAGSYTAPSQYMVQVGSSAHRRSGGVARSCAGAGRGAGPSQGRSCRPGAGYVRACISWKMPGASLSIPATRPGSVLGRYSAYVRQISVCCRGSAPRAGPLGPPARPLEHLCLAVGPVDHLAAPVVILGHVLAQAGLVQPPRILRVGPAGAYVGGAC